MFDMVSVIIPCYNHGQFVDDAVDSVLQQTYKDFEIIIVNDGSTDEYTNNLLSTYDKERTRVIHSRNLGPARARNIAIEQAKGKFILPLDADDRIAPTYIEKAVKVLEENDNVGLVYCDADYFGAKHGRWFLDDYSEKKIKRGNMIFCSALYRKCTWNLVGGYNVNMVYGYEDWDFWLSFVERKFEVVKIPEVLFYYRQHEKKSRNQKFNYRKEILLRVMLIRNHPMLYFRDLSSLLYFLKWVLKNLFQKNNNNDNNIQDEID